MNSEPYTVTGDGSISVCAWCFPGEKIFDIFPDLRGKVRISHGICQAHALRYNTAVKAVSQTEPINVALECLRG